MRIARILAGSFILGGIVGVTMVYLMQDRITTELFKQFFTL